MFHPTNKPVQLVKHLHQIPEKKRIFPASASIKYDGVFAFALPDGRIFSRTGKLCKSLDSLGDKIRNIEWGALNPHVVIFEVYVPGWPLEDISGAFRRQSEQFTEALMYIHDAVPYDKFVTGECRMAYVYRATVARMIADRIGDRAVFVESVTVRSETEAIAYANRIISEGGEGIILRNPLGAWVAGKRNADLTKIKQEESYDLQVVDVCEGEGKYKDTLGSIVVRFNGGEQCVSGMTDAQRDVWWSKPLSIIGKIVEVKCMCLTTDGWMREPRFKAIRHDKLDADA